MAYPGLAPEDSHRHAVGPTTRARRYWQHIDAGYSRRQEPERELLQVGELWPYAAVPPGEVIAARHDRDYAGADTSCSSDGPAPETVVIDAASADTGRCHGKAVRTAPGEVHSIAVPYDEQPCNEETRITWATDGPRVRRGRNR